MERIINEISQNSFENADVEHEETKTWKHKTAMLVRFHINGNMSGRYFQ